MSWEQYERLKVLGQGAFGIVHLCRNTEVAENDADAFVAVKSVSLCAMGEKEAQLAMAESAILRSLDHPHVLRFVDCFVDDDSHLCTVTEFIDGGDLSQMTELGRGNNKINALVVADIAEQILSGLAYLHSNNVLHRDLKPANIYLTRDGFVRIGDFGVAKLLSASMPVAETFIGTPFYVSPELALGEQYTFEADVWSFGVLCYELYVGRLPFAAGNVLALINKLSDGANYDRDSLFARAFSDSTDEPTDLQEQIRQLCAHLIDSALTFDSCKRPSAADLLCRFFQIDAPPPQTLKVEESPRTSISPLLSPGTPAALAALEIDVSENAIIVVEKNAGAITPRKILGTPRFRLEKQHVSPVSTGRLGTVFSHLDAERVERRIRERALAHHKKRLMSESRRRQVDLADLERCGQKEEDTLPASPLTPSVLADVQPTLTVSPMKQTTVEQMEKIRSIAATIVANDMQRQLVHGFVDRWRTQEREGAEDEDCDDRERVVVQIIDASSDRTFKTSVRDSAPFRRLLKNIWRAVGKQSLRSSGCNVVATVLGEFRLSYLDGDGDIVSLRTAADWRHTLMDHTSRHPDQALTLRIH